MPLNISLKNTAAPNNPTFAQLTRQIELWANNYKRIPLNYYGSGSVYFYDAGDGYTQGSWSQDCTGSIHLHGRIQSDTTLSFLTTYQIATLPSIVAPPQGIHRFNILGEHLGYYPAWVDIYPSGVINLIPAATGGDIWNLEGIIYDRTTVNT
jgi:hypothetical protein